MRQITIIGVGLIGGSFALAARRAGFGGRIVGCDSATVLDMALRYGAIDEGCSDAVSAARGSELIMLCAPVGQIIDLLGQAPLFPANALITDVGSTKRAIVERAISVLGNEAPRRFLPGHPLAGKETGGIENVDAELFRHAHWILTPIALIPSIGQPPPHENSPIGPAAEDDGATLNTRAEFQQLITRMGARMVEMDAESHDRLCAWISHLPQMVSTALASVLENQFGENPELLALAGQGLRDMTRLAAGPYSMWRDIALTNTGNIQQAISALEQQLAHIRENLGTRALTEEFESANAFTGKRK